MSTPARTFTPAVAGQEYRVTAFDYAAIKGQHHVAAKLHGTESNWVILSHGADPALTEEEALGGAQKLLFSALLAVLSGAQEVYATAEPDGVHVRYVIADDEAADSEGGFAD